MKARAQPLVTAPTPALSRAAARTQNLDLRAVIDALNAAEIAHHFRWAERPPGSTSSTLLVIVPVAAGPVELVDALRSRDEAEAYARKPRAWVDGGS